MPAIAAEGRWGRFLFRAIVLLPLVAGLGAAETIRGLVQFGSAVLPAVVVRVVVVEALQDTGGGARPLAVRPECAR